MDEPRTWPVRLAQQIVYNIKTEKFAPLTPSELSHLIRIVARMAVREMCLDLPPMADELDCDRADGRCVCRCGLEYRDHPGDTRVLSNFGEPFLTILCDGRRVKL